MPWAQTPATVSFELDSRPDSVACVRAVVAGAGESVGLGRQLLDDLRTAVTEACSNVVLHAYGGRPGPLLVNADLQADGIRITVADRGTGLGSLADAPDRMRVGIPLITALAYRAEFWSVPGEGTEVRMVFAGRDAGAEPGPWLRDHLAARGPRVASSRGFSTGDVVAFLRPSSLLAGILGRVCSVVAARARFTVDRHSDLGLVADAIAAAVVKAAPEGGVGFSVVGRRQRLQLTIGPLPEGSASALGSPSGRGGDWAPPRRGPLARLVDGLDLESGPDGEILRVLMLDRRPPVRVPAAGVSPRR